MMERQKIMTSTDVGVELLWSYHAFSTEILPKHQVDRNFLCLFLNQVRPVEGDADVVSLNAGAVVT